MALFEVDEAASKIRNEVDEHANIIFGSSIDNNLEGILKVSVVATGINRTENIINTQNQINDDEEIAKTLNLNSETETFEISTESSSINNKLDYLDKNTSNQTDLETEINKLGDHHKSTDKESEDILSLENSEDELKRLIEQKPENKFTQSKPQSLLNRVSSLFGNRKINDIKLEPNLNAEKETLINKDLGDDVKIPDVFVKDEKVQNEKSDDKHFKLNEVTKTIENQTDDLDLFNNQPPSLSADHQIDLTDIEQQDKDIDEKVLEIPAFLRRQAN
tara:strand:- start:2 stop:829 length:828 start_codon:yes stop_codon:yes gene_type:complete